MRNEERILRRRLLSLPPSLSSTSGGDTICGSPCLRCRTGARSCRLNSVLRTDSTVVGHEGLYITHPTLCYRCSVVQWSRKLRIFAAALYWTKRAAWSGGDSSWFWFCVNWYIFCKDMRQIDFHISAPSDLDL